MNRFLIKNKVFKVIFLTLGITIAVTACQQELDYTNDLEQNVVLSSNNEILFTIDDGEKTKASSLETDSPKISYGMIRPEGDNGHIANITMESSEMDVTPVLKERVGALTKADVTSLSSFYVTCVTGSAGSESSVWENSTFLLRPYPQGSSVREYSGNPNEKYWSSSNQSYKFYASNASMTFAAGGTTVAATNDKDVVVAYNSSPTYKGTNSLTFRHIFGKIGNVTVTPMDGFESSDITNISMTIVPKTGGTYNIRTSAWSGVTTGSATSIANSTPGTKSNSLYLVPGTYTLTASWQAKGKELEGSADFTVGEGQQKNFGIAVGGELTVLPGVFSVSETKTVNFSRGNLHATLDEKIVSYYEIWSASSWDFAENQYDYSQNYTYANGNIIGFFKWVGERAQYNSYGLIESTGSGDYGIKADTKLKTDWGENLQLMSFLGGGWFTLTYDEMDYLLNTRPSASSKISRGNIGGINGYILLPDSWVLPSNCSFVANGVGYSYTINSYTLGAKGTNNAWRDMENAGAVFLPATGYMLSGGLYNHQESFYIWLNSNDRGASSSSSLLTGDSFYGNPDTGPFLSYDYRDIGLPVRLVRNVGSSLKYIIITNKISTLAPNSSYTIQYETNETGSPTFSSSNTSIATVNGSGVITGVSAGNVTITVTIGSASAQMDLKVKPNYLPGLFSISSSQKVHFAKGNLQAIIGAKDGSIYTASSWKLAEEQWTTIGSSAGNTTFGIGTTVDLFGWNGASSSNDHFGLSTYTSYSYYGTRSGESLKTDWGLIPEFVSAYGSGWFTLNQSQWTYLLQTRTNATQKFGNATVCGKNGTVLLPDDWTLPSNCTFRAGGSSFSYNVYTSEPSGQQNSWIDMENAGAVFLPAGGTRSGTSVSSPTSKSQYYINSAYSGSRGYFVMFSSSSLPGQLSGENRYVGCSVRLVRY